MEIKKLYSKQEVAELLGISWRTVEAWQQRGQIPFFKFSGSPKGAIRFSLDDLEKVYSDSYRPATSPKTTKAK